MFGFSLIKLLFTILAVIVVWQGFKLYRRREAARLAEQRRQSVDRGAAARASADGIEQTQPCPVCGAYVPLRGATPCGRADCPYPG